MKYTSFDHFFMTLGNKQRVRILQYLANAGSKNVSEIADTLKIEQSAASHSLKQLLLCHFVTVMQDGKERVYSINDDTVRPLFELIDLHVKKYCVRGCVHWK